MDSKIKEWIEMARKISKYLLNQTDLSSRREIEEWGESGEREKETFNELKRAEYYIRKSIWKKQINEKYSYDEFITSRKSRILRKRWKIAGYAASILLVLATGMTVWFYPYSPKEQMTVFIPHLTPGSMKASLVLGNGKEIALNSSIRLTEKDGTIIENDTSGELTYQSRKGNDTIMQYNTLRVPRGGEYRLILPDGSKVWVNSESELVFPTQFSSDKREVFLTGEAYFEIARNREQPFYVHSYQMQIHATGTAFNVKAYKNEPDFKVTLIEGGVDIEANQQVISSLTPNLQFLMNKEKGSYEVLAVDPRTATDWKNGIFFFDEEPLSSIIRRLSRWYQIDIQCNKPEINQYRFSGEIRKYEEATRVLDVLKLTNEITYTILPDRKVVISATN